VEVIDPAVDIHGVQPILEIEAGGECWSSSVYRVYAR
jgi:hypothetical protein